MTKLESKNKARTIAALAARSKSRIDVAERRKEELFRSGKWSIIHFDDLNYNLCHDDDTPKDNRYYPTFAAALMGVAKYAKVGSVDDAILQWKKLMAQIAAIQL